MKVSSDLGYTRNVSLVAGVTLTLQLKSRGYLVCCGSGFVSLVRDGQQVQGSLKTRKAQSGLSRMVKEPTDSHLVEVRRNKGRCIHVRYSCLFTHAYSKSTRPSMVPSPPPAGSIRTPCSWDAVQERFSNLICSPFQQLYYLPATHLLLRELHFQGKVGTCLLQAE